MTRKQFYRRLRKVAPQHDWRLTSIGGIRTYFECCPITACDPGKPDAQWAEIVAGRMGLSDLDADAIIGAADNQPDINPRTRAALLRAVGLEDRT